MAYSITTSSAFMSELAKKRQKFVTQTDMEPSRLFLHPKYSREVIASMYTSNISLCRSDDLNSDLYLWGAKVIISEYYTDSFDWDF